MVEVTGWLGEVLPEGMVWKTHVFYSECAEAVSPGSLQVTEAEGKWPSDQGLTRDAAEGTPRGISIWTNWPLTFSSSVPWAYEPLTDQLATVPSAEAVRSRGICPALGGSESHNPGTLSGLQGDDGHQLDISLPSPPTTDEARIPTWFRAISNWSSPPHS